MTEKEKKYKVSAVVLTFNSEKTIKACLESIKWADQIVIVDSGSWDETLRIAGAYTDNIYKRPWPGFAPQWNFAIERAENDWIFILASDECITCELKEEIETVLAGNGDAEGYLVPRKTYFLGKWIRHCGWYPDYSIRLIKKGYGKFDESNVVHEAIKIDGSTAYLKNPILHYSYFTIFEYIDRMNKYTSLAAHQMLRDNVSIEISRIKRLVIRKSLGTFWKMYVRQGGYRDGMHGLLLSIFSSFYKVMAYAKYWQMQNEK